MCEGSWPITNAHTTDAGIPNQRTSDGAIGHAQVVAPYRAQTYSLRRRLLNSSALDRSRLVGSYIQVGCGNGP
jgi:hypothetical protein